MRTDSYSSAFLTCYLAAALLVGFVASVAGGAWTFFGPLGIVLGTLVAAIPATVIIALFFPVTLPVIALAAWWLERRSARRPA